MQNLPYTEKLLGTQSPGRWHPCVTRTLRLGCAPATRSRCSFFEYIRKRNKPAIASTQIQYKYNDRRCSTFHIYMFKASDKSGTVSTLIQDS